VSGATLLGGLGGRPPEDEGTLLGRLAVRLPQRMHDQEKGYSPAFKPAGGYNNEPGQTPEEESEYTEQDRMEKCLLQKEAYNHLLNEYKSNRLEEGTTITDLNEQIRDMNRYFTSFGCPSLPELEPPPPTFAIKR